MAHFSYYLEMAKRIRPFQAGPKVWNYLKYRLMRRKAVTSIRRYTPQIASLILTMRCNLNCGYCNASKILQEGIAKGQEGEATLAKVQRIFGHPLFAHCLFVDLLGGEPLLVEDLDRIVNYLTERGHLTNTSTSGLFLASRIEDLKGAGISRINLSLYEANRAILERDLEKINRIFPVHASLVLLRSMLEKHPEKLMDTVRFAHVAGCLSLRFWMYRPMGLDPNPEEITDDRNPAYLEFQKKIEEAFPGFCLWPAVVRANAREKLCPQLWQRINVNATGDLGICCGTDLFLEGPGGNLFAASPDAAFNHPTLVEMRKNLLDPEGDPPEVCKSCNLLGDPGW